ncbi:hypothetical protein EK599_17935 [Vibrio sp. T187]|nr:hypothetical protein [Vibrio sp. T187]MBW3697566.1 hypothetical protein [Vibrio sp. T187]
MYSKLLLLFLALLIGLVTFNPVRISPRFICLFLMFMSFLVALFFIREDIESAATYLGYVVRWSIAFLFVILFSKERFILAYSNIAFCYSLIAIPLFVFGYLFPDYIYTLPISFNDAGTGYRHIFIYFYQGVSQWNYRNSGLFWEAGAFQVFLMLALIFESFVVKGRIYRRLCIILCMLTTFSTLGIAIVIFYMVGFLSNNYRFSYYIMPTLFAPLFLLFSPIWDVILIKFSSGHSSGSERLIGQLADIEIFTEFPVFGIGLDEYSRYFSRVAIEMGAYIPTSTNSFLGMLSLNGIVYTLIVISCYFAFFLFLKGHFGQKIFAILCLSLVLTTQGVMNQLLFICIILYGMNDISKFLIMKKHDNQEACSP